MSVNIQEEIKEQCREFMVDHYLSFGAFPIEFECNDIVHPFCDYMGWFSDDELNEIIAEAKEPV